MADNSEQVEQVSENVPTIAEQPPSEEATPEPKKRGRPAGAKDKAPRKPRERTLIIEEPPTPPPPPQQHSERNCAASSSTQTKSRSAKN